MYTASGRSQPRSTYAERKGANRHDRVPIGSDGVRFPASRRIQRNAYCHPNGEQPHADSDHGGFHPIRRFSFDCGNGPDLGVD